MFHTFTCIYTSDSICPRGMKWLHVNVPCRTGRGHSWDAFLETYVFTVTLTSLTWFNYCWNRMLHLHSNSVWDVCSYRRVHEFNSHSDRHCSHNQLVTRTWRTAACANSFHYHFICKFFSLSELFLCLKCHKSVKNETTWGVYREKQCFC